MSDPDVPRPVSWGEWCALESRVAKLEELLQARTPNGALVFSTEELVPVPITPRRQIRATRLPEGWQPHASTIMKMANELTVPWEVLHRAHLKFVDYFMSAPGQKGVKVDWDRTWCNWMRTEAERGTLTARTGTVADKALGWMEMGNAATD